MKAHRKEKLTTEERIHLVERFMSIMRTLENLWLQQKLGNLSKEQFDGHLDILRWSISLPLTRELWADIEGSFDPGFRGRNPGDA